MRNMLIVLLALQFLTACQTKNASDTGSEVGLTFHSWAPTPLMGWNSWDCYGPTVTEAEVKANADYMARNLKKSGWEYIVVDIRWFVENDHAGGYNQKDPVYVMDEYGRLTPALNRFPSAAEGKGFKPLADYIHGKGRSGLLECDYRSTGSRISLLLALSKAGINHVYYESPGTDHEWLTWRRDLYEFAQILFK